MSARRTTPRILGALVVALILAVLLAQTLRSATREGGNDLTSFLLSASALVDGGNPYETSSRFPYLYPPFLALALVPLTRVPYTLAVLSWFVLGVAALYVSVRTVVRLVVGRWDAGLVVPLAACFVLLLTPIQNELRNGQVDFVVLLLCLTFVARLAAGRPLAAALFLALGMAVKLTPVVFLPFLLLRRRLGTAALALALSAVACLVPVAVAGPQLLAHLARHVATLGSIALEPPAFPGDYPPFSLAGVVGRAAPALGGGMLLAAAAALVLAVVVWIDRSATRRGPRGGAMEIAQLYLLAMLLISPLSEKHHLALLVPAAVVVTLRWVEHRPSISSPQGALVAAFWLLLVLGGRATLPLHFLAIVTLGAALALPLISASSAPGGPPRARDRA